MPVAAFTTGGSGLWTCPPTITEVMVELWAGGGKGATRTSIGAGGGAGGGAYSLVHTYSVIPGTLYAYRVGFGATAVEVGETSYWVDYYYVRAVGGASPFNNSLTGAAGGQASASLGDIVLSGGNGADGVNGSYGGGGGASTAYGYTSGNAIQYNGGVASPGSGHGGAGRFLPQGSGFPGTSPGGGGGGGLRTSSGTRLGGLGANGKVALSYSNPWYLTHLPAEDRAEEALLQNRMDSIRFELRASLINVQTRTDVESGQNRSATIAQEERLQGIQSEDRAEDS